MPPPLVDLRSRLQEHHGARLAGLQLYGSTARGEAVPRSDLDVLVLLTGPVAAADEIMRTGGIVSDLSLRHDVVIACSFMSVVRFRKGAGPLVRNVAREGIPL